MSMKRALIIRLTAGPLVILVSNVHLLLHVLDTTRGVVTSTEDGEVVVWIVLWLILYNSLIYWLD